MEKEDKDFQTISILIKSKDITLLRKKYDSNYNSKFKNHLTLIYPFSGLDQRLLSAHIKKSIESVKPFKIKFDRFWMFNRNSYIYITSRRDRTKLIKLHKSLNSGFLKHIKISKHMPYYLPHISLVGFRNYKQAERLYKQISGEKLNMDVKVSSIQLMTIDHNHNIKNIKNFKLS